MDIYDRRKEAASGSKYQSPNDVEQQPAREHKHLVEEPKSFEGKPDHLARLEAVHNYLASQCQLLRRERGRSAFLISITMLMVLTQTFSPAHCKLTPQAEQTRVAQAIAIAKKGDYNGAIPLLDEVLNSNPNDKKALYTRGICHLSCWRRDEAYSDIDKLVRLEPQSYRVVYLRAVVHYYRRELEDALADCKTALSLATTQDVLYTMGSVLGNLGRINESRDTFTRLICLDPANWSAYMCRAQCNFVLGDDTKAISDFSVAIKLRPTCWKLYLLRAQVYEEAGKPEKSLDDLKIFTANEPWYAKSSLQALELKSIKPDDPTTGSPARLKQLIQESLLLYNKKRYDEAYQLLSTAMEIDKNSHTARLLRGQVMLAAGKLDQALIDLDQILVLALEDSHEVRFVPRICAEPCLREKDYTRACGYLNLALFWDKYWIDGYYLRAIALDALKKPKESIENYRRYLDLMSHANQNEQLRVNKESAEREKFAKNRIRTLERSNTL
ncbi:MAG: tetratricopeptide repeat protein [Cyanobacteria bacterium]|nr:tetratricopeptide repeat protein [Cyanobacteriota bacterium]